VLRRDVKDFGPQEISGIIFGLAQLGANPDKELLERFTQECSRTRFEGLTPPLLGDLLDGLIKFRHCPGKEFLQGCSEKCSQSGFEDFSLQSHARVINRLARLKHRSSRDYLEGFTEACLRSGFESFTLESLAEAMVGLTNMKHQPGTEFLELFVGDCLRRGVDKFEPSVLVDIFYGLSRLESLPKNELRRFTAAWLRRGFEDFQYRHLTYVTCNLARFDSTQGKEVLGHITHGCVRRRFKDFTPGGFASTLEFLASYEHHPGDEFLTGLVVACLALGLEKFRPSDVYRIRRGLASLGHHPDEPEMANLKFEEQLVHGFRSGLSSPQLAGTFKAFALLGQQPSRPFLEELIKACITVAKSRTGFRAGLTPGFSLDDMTGLVWALDTLDVVDRPDVDQLFYALAARVDPLLAHAAGAEGGDGDGAGAGTTEELRAAVGAAMGRRRVMIRALFALWEATERRPRPHGAQGTKLPR
jgi:hypothetical protein